MHDAGWLALQPGLGGAFPMAININSTLLHPSRVGHKRDKHSGHLHWATHPQ